MVVYGVLIRRAQSIRNIAGKGHTHEYGAEGTRTLRPRYGCSLQGECILFEPLTVSRNEGAFPEREKSCKERYTACWTHHIAVGDFSQSSTKPLTPHHNHQMDSPLSKGTKLQQEEPTIVQIDPKWCAKLILSLQLENY